MTTVLISQRTVKEVRMRLKLAWRALKGKPVMAFCEIHGSSVRFRKGSHVLTYRNVFVDERSQRRK